MSKANEYLNNVIEFMGIHRNLIDCHLVDFFTNDLWNQCIPENLKKIGEDISADANIWSEIIMYPEFKSYINQTKSLYLNSFPDIIDVRKNLNFINTFIQSSQKNDNNIVTNKLILMNEKKSHEVEIFGKLIAEIVNTTKSIVIDAGAGKGYLSNHIADSYSIPVLAIDSSKTCHNGAMRRQDKMRKSKSHSSSQIYYTVEEINEETNFDQLLKPFFPDYSVNNSILLTGLHTCGSLAHSLLKSFVKTNNIKILCCVPCCYHLTDELLTKKFMLTKNARMLAQQCIERTMNKQKISNTTFFRAVLQVVFNSIGIHNAIVGRGGPETSFEKYAQWAFDKMNIEDAKIPSSKALNDIYDIYSRRKFQFDVFQIIRIFMGPVVEASIMLDRFIFLQEYGNCDKVGIIQLFDPLLSPRCYAIIATK